MNLFPFLDEFSLEAAVIVKLRNFLTSFYDFEITISRDLQTNPMPAVMVWCRIIGPAVRNGWELDQYQTFQISVSSEDTVDKDGRQISSEITALIRAYMASQEFLGKPIMNCETSGAFLTSELDGFNRPASTFTASVYQAATTLTV